MTIATASLVDVLVGATTDVFDTMIFRQLQARDTAWGPATRPKSQIVGTVGFAGASTGLVGFHTSIGAAKEITGAMLGMDMDQEGLADAVGEVTNMIGSDFYSKPIPPGTASS